MRPSRPLEGYDVPSAATYFDQRPSTSGPTLQNAEVNLSLMEHTIRISSEGTRHNIKFPQPAEAYFIRDVTETDWSTFINFLFPGHDEVTNNEIKPANDLQRHVSSSEVAAKHQNNIQNVVAEWNANFFNPRHIRVNAEFKPLPSSSARPTSDASASRSLPMQTSIYRSHSASTTTSSSSSSSSSSIDSLSSEDFEGTDIGQVRSALQAFRLDPRNKDQLRRSVRQLHDQFQSQRRDVSWRDRKDVKREQKEQKKELKKEFKAIIKELKAEHKADRKIRKVERKRRRSEKKAERHCSSPHARSSQEKAQRAIEKVQAKAMRAQQRSREAQERAAERSMRDQRRSREAEERAGERVQEAQARENTARRASEARTEAGRPWGSWWGLTG